MDPATSAVAAVLQWNDDGSRTIVFPPSIADGEIRLPAGLRAVK
jgi:branched-chain amino acid transport system substrate-binding protein